MKIFKKIKDSIYNPSFYSEQKDLPTRSAFFYLVKLVLIIVLLLTIFTSFKLIPTVLNLTSEKTLNDVANTFPEELTLTLKDGSLSTNVIEPYNIPLKKIDNKGLKPYKNSPDIENLVTIDTKSPFSLELFENSKSVIFLSKNYMLSRKQSSGQITIQPLRSMPDIEISRNKISEWITIIQPYFKFVIPVLLLLYFIIVFIGLTINSLITIVLISLVILCIVKIRKIQLTFNQIYRLGFYAITSVLIIHLVLNIFGFSSVWYVNTIIFLVTFYFNVKSKKEIMIVPPANI